MAERKKDKISEWNGKRILESAEKNDKICIASAISIIFSTVAVWFLGFTIIPQVYAMTKEFVAFGEDSFGTQSLLRLGGYLLGFLTIFLIALSVQKV